MAWCFSTRASVATVLSTHDFAFPAINTFRPRQNGCHFADDTFKRIFLWENVRISIEISLNFVLKSPIDNIPTLFQIMAWRRTGDKPLSEAMTVSLLTHICVARPQWVNWLTQRFRQNSWYFEDSSLKSIFLKEIWYILLQISLDFVSNGSNVFVSKLV